MTSTEQTAQVTPPLGGGGGGLEVFFLIDSTIDQLRGPRLQAALAALPEWRRAEALAYKFESGQAQCAAAYLLLCRILRECYGITEQPRFIIGEHGKPELDLSAGLHFNLSHCKEAVAAVVAEEPVGIDVEMRGRYRPSLAEYVCSPEELRWLEDGDRVGQDTLTPGENEGDCGRDLRFTQLWTRKESALKLLGTGITGSEGLKGLLAEDRFLFDTRIYPRYVCTIATFRK